MSDLLFDVPVCESPRLRWMKNHRVKTHEFTNDPSDERTLNHLGFSRWVAHVGRMPAHEDEGVYALGSTEDLALVSLAQGMGWRLWNEETAIKVPLNSKAAKRPTALSTVQPADGLNLEGRERG